MGRAISPCRLRKRAIEVTAIDPNAPDGSIFRRVGIEDFAGPGPYDAVIASWSLHHVADLEAALDRIASLLAPDGILVLVEFAHERMRGRTAAWFHRQEQALAALGLARPVAESVDDWLRALGGRARRSPQRRGDRGGDRQALRRARARVGAVPVRVRARRGARAAGASADRARAHRGHGVSLRRLATITASPRVRSHRRPDRRAARRAHVRRRVRLPGRRCLRTSSPLARHARAAAELASAVIRSRGVTTGVASRTVRHRVARLRGTR